MKSLEVQLADILNEYEHKLDKAATEAAFEAATATARTLKQTSPKGKGKGRGRYARGWTVSPSGGGKGRKGGINNLNFGYTVHNKTDYQLTHLLENGHVIRNQAGTWGRVKPQKHIAPAEEVGIMRYELGLKARLR